ncbi:MAG: hypothetical protein JOZ18_01265, partial [Chloroflexi bacterium]|nr:hypothetical protein [Chloroflexota bacterium]
DPHWCDYILFHEFFHGDNGLGLGASHQTGWTGLAAVLLQQQSMRESMQDLMEVSHTGLLRAPTGHHKLPERR